MTSHPHDRRDEMPVNRSKQPPYRTADKITHGVIHMTGVDGKTADQHARFHTTPLPNGRDWPVVAYTSYIGTDARRELLLDYEVVGYHAGNLNGKSIGIVVEGNLNERGLPEDVIQAVADECLWHDTSLGRRLIWTFHNDVMENRTCPGKHFPKAEVLARIEAYYQQDEEPAGNDEDGPADEPRPDDETDPEDDDPDYDSPPGDMSGGCMGTIALMINAFNII